jgi:hypothetical protein
MKVMLSTRVLCTTRMQLAPTVRLETVLNDVGTLPVEKLHAEWCDTCELFALNVNKATIYR